MVCCALPGMTESFETNLRRESCSKWTLRLVNFVMILVGIAGFFFAAAAIISDFPLGSWPIATVSLAGIFVAMGVVGICATNRGCALLALLYFCVLFMVTVLMVFLGMYAFFNRDSFEVNLRSKFEKQWPKYHDVIKQGGALEPLAARMTNCTVLDDPCWDSFKGFMHEQTTSVLVVVVAIVLMQKILLYSSVKVIGTANAANAVGLLMDTVTLVIGCIITFNGYFMMPAGTSSIKLVVCCTGLALIGMATLFGTYCGKFYEKCCDSCSAPWALASLLYFLLACAVLVLGVVILTNERTLTYWVRSNMDKVCTMECMVDLRADLLHGMVQTNPACANVTASNRTNATISSCPKMVSPAVCYDAAVKVCDFHAAAQASFVMGVEESMESAGWFMVLAFLYLVVQVFCKMYKWRYEDFYLSTHGFTGIPQDNEPKHNEMRHLV